MPRGKASGPVGLGKGPDQQSDVIHLWLPRGEWAIDQQKGKVGAQMGGCGSSPGKKRRGLEPGRVLAVEMERNGWIRVMVRKSRRQELVVDWT